MTVKVSKARLIAAITAERTRVIAEHKAQAGEAAKRFREYRASVGLVLTSFAAEVKTAKKFEDITTDLQYGRNLKLPESPKQFAEPNTKKYDKALAQLALVEDETISLSEKNDGDFLALVSA